MKIKTIKLESFVATIIVIILVAIVYGSTSNSLAKAKDNLTKNNLYQLQQAINVLIGEKVDLQKHFSDCNEIGGAWCEITADFASLHLVGKTDPPIPLLSGELKDSTNAFLSLQVTGKESYIVKGVSTKGKSKCWIASSDEKSTNLKSDPSPCP